MTGEKSVCVGQFLGAHGVRGQVKLASFTEDPASILSYGPLLDERGSRTFEVVLLGWNKTHFIAGVAGITDRSAAEKLKGLRLYVPRARLPAVRPGQYYYTDLIGLEARLEDGTRFGKVVSVRNFGAGDILEVRPADGRQNVLYPFSNAVVPEVRLEEGFLILVPPEYAPGGGDGP